MYQNDESTHSCSESSEANPQEVAHSSAATLHPKRALLHMSTQELSTLQKRSKQPLDHQDTDRTEFEEAAVIDEVVLAIVRSNTPGCTMVNLTSGLPQELQVTRDSPNGVIWLADKQKNLVYWPEPLHERVVDALQRLVQEVH